MPSFPQISYITTKENLVIIEQLTIQISRNRKPITSEVFQL